MASTSLNALLGRTAGLLERGRGAEAAQVLAPVFRSSTLTRDEDIAVRCMLAEAWLLQDDLDQAASVLGRTPDTLRETVSPGRLSGLWRLHGRLASARGDQSRAIALHGRALKQAELAHDSRAIGLAHYELGQCYRQVGDIAHRPGAHQQGGVRVARRRRPPTSRAGPFSQSISLAQLGRYDEAMTALRHAERLADRSTSQRRARHGRAVSRRVMMLQHRYDQGSRWRSAAWRSTRRTARVMARGRARDARPDPRSSRRSERRQPMRSIARSTSKPRFNSTKRRRRLRHAGTDSADARRLRDGQRLPHQGQRGVRRLRPANQPVVRVVGPNPGRTNRLQQGSSTRPCRAPTRSLHAGAPPLDSLQATLIAAEALIAANKTTEAEQRLAKVADDLDPKTAPAAWGEYLRLRGALDAKNGSPPMRIMPIAQSSRSWTFSASDIKPA